MLKTEFKSIIDLLTTFPDEESCIKHLESLLWPQGPVSPFDSMSKVYKCRNNRYYCKNSNRYFNVKNGTCFEDTKLPLRKWFVAIWFFTNHKRGISSCQLATEIDVTQKTAWFMLQRLRFCLENDEQKNQGTVELDETFVGGKNSNRHMNKRVKNNSGRSFKDKTPVFGMLERETKKIKLFAIKSTSGKLIRPHIHNNISYTATLISDEWHAYRGLDEFYIHKIIDHSRHEYVSRENTFVHTNSIEGVWTTLKKVYHGTYYHITPRHLQLYCNEISYRWNTMQMKAYERVNGLLTRLGKRLKFKTILTGEV